MSIRRISELPNLTSYYPTAQLSNGLFEISYDVLEGGHQFKSFYTNGYDLIHTTIQSIGSEDVTNINITSALNINGGVLNITSGGSIIAWPNDGDGSETTSCYLRFGEIKISSDSFLELGGDPIILNNNLTVTNSLVSTNKQVSFTNTGNIINAAYCSPTGDTPNRVVTLGMMNEVVGIPTAALQNLARGSVD